MEVIRFIDLLADISEKKNTDQNQEIVFGQNYNGGTE